MICTEATCIEESFITMHFGIGKYAGGGMKVLPHAGKQDSCIYGIAAEQMPRIKILINMWRFYFGDITKMKQVHHFKSKEVEIKAVHDALPVEADGELLGYTPVKISILPQAIQTLSIS